MISQIIHHHSERQKMTAHDKDQKQQLRSSQHFATDATHQDLTGITHAVHMRVAEFELSEGIARVSCQSTEAKDEDHGSARLS